MKNNLQQGNLSSSLGPKFQRNYLPHCKAKKNHRKENTIPSTTTKCTKYLATTFESYVHLTTTIAEDLRETNIPSTPHVILNKDISYINSLKMENTTKKPFSEGGKKGNERKRDHMQKE